MAEQPRKRRPAPPPEIAPEVAPDGPPRVVDILDGRASGIAGEAGAAKASPFDELAEFKDMLAEQRERQGRLRHVQQFLTSPLFLDLSDTPVTVSEDRHAIDERKRDLDYRIKVLESLCAILIEERDFLDRVRSPEEAAEAEDMGRARAG